jgi:hypothetical protein
VSAVGMCVCVPTTRLARPSQKCPIADFSLVASACMSTMMASQAAPSGQLSSCASTAAKGSSSASMCTRPSALITSTRRPPDTSKSQAPDPARLTGGGS